MVKQVCGNSEHVRFLSEWLKGWDERGHKTGVATRDTNDSSYQDESDADYSDDASDCDNVLLITGPVGVSATLTNTCHLNCMFHLNVFYLGFFCVFSDASSFFLVNVCLSESHPEGHPSHPEGKWVTQQWALFWKSLCDMLVLFIYNSENTSFFIVLEC